MNTRCLVLNRQAFLVALFLIFSGIGTQGQGTYRFFYGKVINSITEAPIPDVNLRFETLKTGTVTDKKGDFSVYIDSVPVIMVVSHLGYETRKIYLDNTSYSLMIEMTPSVQQLSEVEITALGTAEPLSRPRTTTVLDYEPDSGYVITLSTRLRTNDDLLVFRKGEGDTLAVRSMSGSNARRLFRDCLGNIHLVTRDSVFQLFRTGDSITLLYGVTIKRFNALLADCVLSTEELLFFKKTEKHELGISYFTVNRTSHERQVISSMNDSARLRMAKKNPGDWNLLLRKRVPEGREDFVTWSYVHKILYRPLSSSLFKAAGYICALNSSDHTIEFYRPDGSYSSKLLINITNGEEGKWCGEVYPDGMTCKVYTAFSRNGYYTLYRIDLNTGELKRCAAIEKVYPDKIRVQNGFVYYLCREPGENRTVDLYRQRL